MTAAVGRLSDGIVAGIACPACGVEAGVPCRTYIDGVDVAWTHDARVYAHLALAFRAAANP